MPNDALHGLATEVVDRLRERGETVAVAESAAGGLIAAALVAVPGASTVFRGGVVVYQRDAARRLLHAVPPFPAGEPGATRPFAEWLAGATAAVHDADWGIGETGAAGPTGNPYGDPAGHAWVALRTPGDARRARHVLTGVVDRRANMVAFAAAALEQLREAPA